MKRPFYMLFPNTTSKNVHCGVHYPVPLYLQPSCPHTEKAAERILSLPMYAELTDEQIGDETSTLEACVRERR